MKFWIAGNRLSYKRCDKRIRFISWCHQMIRSAMQEEKSKLLAQINEDFPVADLERLRRLDRKLETRDIGRFYEVIFFFC